MIISLDIKNVVVYISEKLVLLGTFTVELPF